MVESIGEHVDGFKQGDVVLPVFHPHCEECRDCKSSKANWCTRFAEDIVSNTRRYGMASRFKDSMGEDIHHFFFVSSFSEYTVVDIAHLVKISPEIPVDRAVLLSCGVSTGSIFSSSIFVVLVFVVEIYIPNITGENVDRNRNQQGCCGCF